VWLYTRNGSNFADRFPRIIEAVKSLPVRSCYIDGEAIVVDANGLATFDLLRSWRHNHVAMLCAFDVRGQSFLTSGYCSVACHSRKPASTLTPFGAETSSGTKKSAASFCVGSTR